MRSIEPDDLGLMCCWLIDMHDESPAYHDTSIDLEHSVPILEQALGTGTFFGVIDPEIGMMMGTITSTWFDPVNRAYEQVLYVLPHRRGGIAAVRLVKAFEKECKARGASDIIVGNSAGIVDDLGRLYKALGYTDKFGTLRKRL